MKWLQNKLYALLEKESSIDLLTLSFCVGNYIAFSPYPFPFGHTMLVFILSWLLGLNTSVVFFAAFFINNPWTAIPVYSLDYGFGYFLMHTILGGSYLPSNPAFMNSINLFLATKLGIPKLCLWSFLIGGNLLGIITSVMLYPIMKSVFSKLVRSAQTSQP